jgi:23S rRNA pseudouridine2457 synthase
VAGGFGVKLRLPMPKIILFNKPFNVLTQFRPDGDRATLAQFITDPSLRVAGRLDRDSEGLLLLTDDGVLNARITQPQEKQFKTYRVQVDGTPTDAALQALRQGVLLNDGMTLPAEAVQIDEPSGLWPRTPPVRYRAHLPTAWLEIRICEGRNRQVRRMTAAVGLPTLRLVRVQIGAYRLGDLQPGAWTEFV